MAETCGYWVECIPVRKGSFFTASPSLYAASVSDRPDIKAWGLNPNRAITKLRRRLAHLQEEAEQKHVALLPNAHNRLSPPHRLRGQAGWLSVYIDLAGATGNA
jgi:hypothetical protein